MKTSERLYKSVEQIWKSYNEHPFVKGIGDGSLDQDKFRFYMIQDYLYLLDYSKVFALGVVKARKEEHMRLFASLVASTLNTEMSIHKAYMEKLGITKAEIKGASPSLTTESYTKYMLAVGNNEGIAEIAVAVLACSWSYKCIGDYLARVPEALEHPFYGEWVQGYSSTAYGEGNDVIIHLVDELTQDYTEEQIQHLETIIVNCSRYEYMFWDMSWNKEM